MRTTGFVNPGYAPYLDYRPITDEERPLVTTVLEAEWLSGSPESQIIGYAVEHLIPEHLNEVKVHIKRNSFRRR